MLGRARKQSSSYDFAIIGAGIAGVSAAAALAPFGRVVVLEAEEHMAYHASGRSAAMYLAGYGNQIIQSMTSASGDHLHFANGGVLRKRGLLLLGQAGEEERFARAAAQGGLARVSVEDASVYFPILDPAKVTMAAFRPDAYDIDTHQLMQNYTNIARADKAEFRLSTRVLGLTRTTEGWQIDLPQGQLQATIIVNAAGAWADQIAELAGLAPVGLIPCRRSVVRIPAPGGAFTRHWPFVDTPDERWYAKPDAGHLLVSPGDEDPSSPSDAYPDEMVLAEGLARYEDMVTEPVTRVLNNWAGLRTFARDRSPVIGFDPQDGGFFWLAGQGGYGFQTAPAASDLVADLIIGRNSSLPSQVVRALSPDRLKD